MFRFRFNELKAAEAAAYLIWRHGGEYDYLSTLKLLYLADREALIEIGVPITGDKMVEMKLGPVLSEVMNRLKGTVTTAIWRRYISQADAKHRVRLLTTDEEFKELSEYEISVLDRIDDKYGDKTRAELIDLCHELPEIERRASGQQQIFPEKILRKARVPDARVKTLRSHAEALWRAHGARPHPA